MANKPNERKDLRLSEAQMIQPGMKEIARAEHADVLTSSTNEASGLAEEYRYVVADLKRIGAIAVVMLAVLIALVLLLP